MKRSLSLLCVLAACCILSCVSSQKRLKPPRVQSDSKLDYPIAAQMDGIEGQVDLGLFVNSSGVPDEVKVMKSSGHAVLDDAALVFAKKVTFEPAQVDGKAVSAWTRLVLRYRLSEVAFDRTRWLNEVHYFQRQAEEERDSVKRETIYRRLYTNYAGLMNYAENSPEPAVNDIVRQIIDERTKARWQPFWNRYVAAFVAWDDFLLRYPESVLCDRVKEDLLKALLDVEFKIRLDYLRSEAKAEKAPALIDLVEERLKELGYNAMPLNQLKP
jgi:TonB family protein